MEPSVKIVIFVKFTLGNTKFFLFYEHFLSFSIYFIRGVRKIGETSVLQEIPIESDERKRKATENLCGWYVVSERIFGAKLLEKQGRSKEQNVPNEREK